MLVLTLNVARASQVPFRHGRSGLRWMSLRSNRYAVIVAPCVLADSALGRLGWWNTEDLGRESTWLSGWLIRISVIFK